MVIVRENQLKIMVSDDEHTKLRDLADRQQVSASDVVRRLIREAYAAAETEVMAAIIAVRAEQLPPSVLDHLRTTAEFDPIARRVLERNQLLGATKKATKRKR